MSGPWFYVKVGVLMVLAFGAGMLRRSLFDRMKDEHQREKQEKERNES